MIVNGSRTLKAIIITKDEALYGQILILLKVLFLTTLSSTTNYVSEGMDLLIMPCYG